MNSQELQLVDTVLRGLMNPNNEERKISENQLGQLMQNKPALILVLSQLLTTNTDSLVLIYASVVLRKLIQVKESEEINSDWTSIPQEAKDQIKQNVLIALSKFTEKKLKKKVSDIVCNLCENIYNSNGQWDEALKYIINGFSIPITQENSLTIETSVYLLSKIFSFANKQLIEGIDLFIKGFHLFFKQANLDIQTITVEAICEMLGDQMEKKNSRKFRDFTFNILKTILDCLNQNQIDNLKICVIALSDICTVKPIMLKKSFGDIFILMGKIIEKTELDEENVRGVAFNVLLTLVERFSFLLNNDEEKMSVLIKSLFKYAMEFEREIDDEWLTPKSLSLADEDFIQETKIDEALSYIERLLNAVNRQIGLPIVSNIVMELLQHSTQDWRYKYLAYISIGKICSFVDDYSSINKVITMIFDDQANPNPKIRYSCLYAFVQMATVFHESFTNNFHSVLVPSLTSLFTNETVLRVKLQISDTLQTFLEECPNRVIPLYIQIILDSLFSVYIKSEIECPISLREAILETLSQLLDKSGDDFKQYAEKCLSILSGSLQSILKNKDEKLLNLSPLLLDTLTHVGTFAPETLKHSALDISKIIVNFQDNIKSFKGEFGDFIQSSWERILPYLIENHKDVIPSIIESTIKVIEKPPEMSIASNPNQAIDIQKFISEINISGSSIKLERKRIESVNTSETEEYAAFLRILCLFLEDLREYSIPYAEIVYKQAKRLTTYPNIDIRSIACKFYPLIIKIVNTQFSKDKIADLIKCDLSELVELCLQEKEREVVSSLLDSICDLLAVQNQIMTQTELNQLFTKLFEIFDNIELDRIALLVEEKETIKEIQLSKSNPEDDSDDDKEEDLENIKDQISELEDVLISYTDVIGELFKTHRELSIEIANKIITTVLPKYLANTASVFEKKMGLFILDDMVEHLGQNLLNQIWSDISKILITYIDHPSCELRQAASFGLGEFIKHTNQNYEQYAAAILAALKKGLSISSDGVDEKEYGNAQDNIVVALGKLIKHQGTHYPLSEVITLWLKNLPIVYDYGESCGMHELLCDIIIQSPINILGNNNENVQKIIRILCQIVLSKKFSNDAIDEKISKILNGFKENEVFRPHIEMARKDCTKKVERKINEYFSK